MSRRSRQGGQTSDRGSTTPRALRCAIYTRVSTDHGLEQDFNSLDAQREACTAYIRSQGHEGWVLAPGHYDDGGYSGGNLDRPALKAMLEAVEARRIDVIVVYKVDRLTRSLADFAKLVEMFDAAGVSFISITQSFNTTTSMGRLTLNMLLSFAQFEREVTGERIRDKIAASKRKGIWVGGVVPLGYRVEERKLLIDEAEAETVRLIFDRYLALGSLGPVVDDLRSRGVVTRVRSLATGKVVGGVPFTRGPLAYLLKNRMYLGELNHGSTSYPGEHAPIIARHVFDAVQAKTSVQAAAYSYQQLRSDALLTGKLFDQFGRPMTPSYAVKGGVRYRYYISRRTAEPGEGATAPTVRLPAPDIEMRVLDALMAAGLPIQSTRSFATGGLGDERDDGALHAEGARDLLDRVSIRPDEIEISLSAGATETIGRSTIVIPWSKPPTRVRRDIIAPPEGQWEDPRAMSSDTRSRLLASIAAARRWLDDLVTGRAADIEALAARERRSARSVTMQLSLAFLAPDLVRAIVENRIRRGIGLTRITDLPIEWSDQQRELGLGDAAKNRS
jgi:site-specific DNA recombinase